MVVFDHKPKCGEDIFDRTREFEILEDAIQRFPIIALTGVRRVGKTSVLCSFTHRTDGIFIDFRRITYARKHFSEKEIVGEIIRILGKKKSSLSKILNEIDEVTLNLLGVGVKFHPFKTYESTLIDILAKLNREGEEKDIPIILAFDESQYLSEYQGDPNRFLILLGHICDNYEHLRVILSEARLGFLDRFLNTENYSSPLFDRPVKWITLPPFDPITSIEFLKEGFNELGMSIPIDEIEQAVNILGGIPGWLVEFGLKRKESNFENAIKHTLSKAKAVLVDGELRYLKEQSPSYEQIIKGIVLGHNTLETLQGYLNAQGITLHRKLETELEYLTKLGWIKKEKGKYTIADPIFEKALRMNR
ncbi:ATP-binding protein [Thermococcus atlanticus]